MTKPVIKIVKRPERSDAKKIQPVASAKAQEREASERMVKTVTTWIHEHERQTSREAQRHFRSLFKEALPE